MHSGFKLLRNPHKMPVLQITGGKVQGVRTTTEGVLLYKGIPFAAPPTGDLRWKAPQPVVPWMGVLKADKFGPAAIRPIEIRTLKCRMESLIM